MPFLDAKGEGMVHTKTEWRVSWEVGQKRGLERGRKRKTRLQTGRRRRKRHTDNHTVWIQRQRWRHREGSYFKKKRRKETFWHWKP